MEGRGQKAPDRHPGLDGKMDRWTDRHTHKAKPKHPRYAGCNNHKALMQSKPISLFPLLSASSAVNHVKRQFPGALGVASFSQLSSIICSGRKH